MSFLELAGWLIPDRAPAVMAAAAAAEAGANPSLGGMFSLPLSSHALGDLLSSSEISSVPADCVKVHSLTMKSCWTAVSS